MPVHAAPDAGKIHASGNFSKYATINPEIFSKLEYIDYCTGQTYQRWIEPLAGLFRHPRSMCGQESELHRAHVEDRAYILLGGASPDTLQQMYPGKHYLFDFGTFRCEPPAACLWESLLAGPHCCACASMLCKPCFHCASDNPCNH